MGGVDSLENLFVDKVMVGNSGLDSEWVLEVQRDVRVEGGSHGGQYGEVCHPGQCSQKDGQAE